MDKAALHGHITILQYLHEHSTKAGIDNCYCNPLIAFHIAARAQKLDVVKYLYKTYNLQYNNAITYAAANGDVEMGRIGDLDHACLHGHLNVVKYLHSQGNLCTTNAMDWAAKNNHFEIVEFLHENRKEGCTTSAFDIAAEKGYLNIVQFLNTNRKEGFTSKALTKAVQYGHFEVIKGDDNQMTQIKYLLDKLEDREDFIRFCGVGEGLY
eukprot:Pgem_evm1s8124